MSRYYTGLIVWASIKDGRGHTKTRPAVVIAIDDGDDPDSDLLVVPITKKPNTPCPHYHIQVHASNASDPLTGLYYPCWAKCNWAGWLEQRKIIRKCGDMPDDLLDKIIRAYEEIYDDEKFNDWQ